MPRDPKRRDRRADSDAAARHGEPPASPNRDEPAAEQDEPTVEIAAGATAKRLRFHERPRTEVEVHGEVVEPERREPIETDTGSARENLPDEVEPDVTYRDISVGWHARGKLR